MTMKINIGGVWKDVAAVKVNIDGVWKAVSKITGNVGGVWKSLFESDGKYQLLADVTVAAATSSVNLTGFSISKEDEILLVADIINPTASNSIMYLYANGDTTQSDYYVQRLDYETSTRSAARYNIPQIAATIAGTRNVSFIRVRLSNSGIITYFDETVRKYGGAAIEWHQYFGSSTYAAAAITQLTVAASISGAIGVGSRFRLYKIGGTA